MGGVSRWIGGVAAIALAAGALYAAVENGRIAMAVAGGQAERALAIDARSPRALTAAAAASGADPVRAATLAARALARAPLDAEALRVLGLARLARDPGGEGGLRAMQLAGALGWRDTPTQYWLLDAAAQAGDWPTMAQRGDALARRRVGRTDVYAILRAAAADPAAATAVAERLTLRPSWRREFFEDVALLEDDDDPGMANLFDALRRAGAAADAGELAPYLTRLVQRGRFAEARAAWRRWARGDAAAAQPFDGEFDTARPTGEDTAPFEWHVPRREGGPAGQVGVEADSETGDRYLVAEAFAGGVGPLVAQTLVLAPGRYRLRIERQADRAEALTAFRWRLTCAGQGGDLPLDFTPPGQSRAGWSTVEARFDVPAGCPGQSLSLDARALGMAGGAVARFDSVTLTRAAD